MSSKPSYHELEKRVQELEQLELRRKQTEEELSQIFTMSLDMICVADINTATFTKVNPAFTAILGYSEEELITHPFLDFIHPEDIDETKNVIEKKLQMGAKVINFENRYRCKDGSYRWLSWVSHPAVEKGMTFAVARDISELKKHQEELRKSKALLDATGRMAKVGGWELDASTLEVTWTEETYRIHEVPPGYEPLLQEAISFFHPDDRERLEQAIQRSLDHGEPYDMEIRFVTAQGKPLWTRTSCQPEIVDGKIVRLKGTFQDITERKTAEKALKESEERHRSVLDTIDEGIILQSAAGKILIWNKGAEDIFGIASEDAIGRTSENTDWPTIHEDGSKFEGKDHPSMQTLRTGKPCKNQIMGVYHPSGDLRWISVNTNLLYGQESQEPYAVAISFSDITEFKRIEQALRTSEKELLQTLEATTDGIWTWNFKTNKLSFSSRYYTMLGYMPNEFPADFENWLNLIHPDDKEKTLAVATAYIEKKPDVYQNEFRLRTKSGDYRWVRAIAKVVERDENGDAVYMIGNHEDITERKLALEALIQERERFDLAMRSVNDGLWDWNLKTNEIYYSPVWKKLIGYEDDEIQNEFSEWERLTHPEDVRSSWEMINAVLEGKEERFHKEFKMRHKDGHWVDILSRANVIFDEQGQGIRVVGTHVDITERKKLEQSLQKSQKMEAIGTLAGGIAHDFNNILFPIIGMSEFLMEDLTPGSPEREYAEEIFKAGKRGGELVKQILAFSRRSEHQMIPTHVQHILREVLTLSRSVIPSYIEINQDIEPNCGLVMADPTQIHQIAMNIITNAYHAIEEVTEGRIEVQLKECELSGGDSSKLGVAPGRYAVLSISDNGHGMPADVIEKIFDPYFTTKKQGKGTGLGLAVVYGIVQEHKGTIKVYSEAGKGTTLHIYLPLMDKPVAVENRDVIEQDFTGSERILLVDDEEPIANLEKQMLERLGYQVAACLDSIDALDAFKAQKDRYDLVITDMSMPSMTGDQLAKEILSIRPETPVIICTGFSERIDEEKAKEIGVKGLLMKPVVKTELLKLVRNVLDEQIDTGVRIFST